MSSDEVTLEQRPFPLFSNAQRRRPTPSLMPLAAVPKHAAKQSLFSYKSGGLRTVIDLTGWCLLLP